MTGTALDATLLVTHIELLRRYCVGPLPRASDVCLVSVMMSQMTMSCSDRHLDPDYLDHLIEDDWGMTLHTVPKGPTLPYGCYLVFESYGRAYPVTPTENPHPKTGYE